jgi:hypothetical protein
MQTKPAFSLIALVLCFLAVGGGSAQAGSETSRSSSECTARGDVGSVTVLICPSGLSREALRDAGQEVCARAGEICNAWIWDHSDKAPKHPPATDSGLSKDQVRNAVAVWIKGAERLMILRRVAE